MTDKKPPTAWTEAECDACIQAYGWMLLQETAGITYSKAAVNRVLRGEQKDFDHLSTRTSEHIQGRIDAKLAARSRGSIEAKMMNISAARESLGLPIIKGYKPLKNMQALLKQRVVALCAPALDAEAREFIRDHAR